MHETVALVFPLHLEDVDVVRCICIPRSDWGQLRGISRGGNCVHRRSAR